MFILFNIGDSLDEKSGRQFTTKDSDNDVKTGKNCAQLWHGAWWYRACHACNLNGRYYNESFSATDIGDSIHWETWKGDRRPLKKTEMKIREN